MSCSRATAVTVPSFNRGHAQDLYAGCRRCVPASLATLTGINFVRGSVPLLAVSAMADHAAPFPRHQIFYYGVTFFRSTGAKNPFVFSVVSNVVHVLATVPGMWMMERVGRRPLFLYGAVWMFVAQLIVAIVGTVDSIHKPFAQMAAVAFTCIYIAGFAATWGPLTWVA